MIRAANGSEDPLYIYLGSDTEEVDLAAQDKDIGTGLVLKAGENSPADVTIDGGGRVIALTGEGKGSVITVGSGVTLTLKSITFVGKNDNNKALIKVDGGTLVLDKDAVIKGNTNTGDDGGGVFVCKGTFSMKGGTISDNKSTKADGSDYGGGGVVVYGKFEMSGGIISGNEAARCGGGVYVYGGKFEMSGGTISGNKVTGGDNGNDTGGGGVFVNDGGAFSMSDGTISVNEVTGGSGGGVSVYYYSNCKFEMSGGTISGNKATESGGGVYNNCTFTKQPAVNSSASGVIYGNEVEETTLRNTAKNDTSGHAVMSAPNGGRKRNATADWDVTLNSVTDGNWDPKQG
jgi:hypothetical protein